MSLYITFRPSTNSLIYRRSWCCRHDVLIASLFLSARYNAHVLRQAQYGFVCLSPADSSLSKVVPDKISHEQYPCSFLTDPLQLILCHPSHTSRSIETSISQSPLPPIDPHHHDLPYSEYNPPSSVPPYPKPPDTVLSSHTSCQTQYLSSSTSIQTYPPINQQSPRPHTISPRQTPSISALRSSGALLTYPERHKTRERKGV